MFRRLRAFPGRLLHRLVAGLRVVVRDRHDALTYLAVGSLTAGAGLEFGRAWALMVVGSLCFALAWKGLR